MSNAMAVIGAALITVAGSVFTYLLTLKSNKRISMAASEERFFYQIFSKRLALYEDIALWSYNLYNKNNGQACPNRDIIASLLGLESRSKLYGTKELEDILCTLRNSFMKAFAELGNSPVNTSPMIYAYLVNLVKDDLDKLLAYIESQPYTAHIDRIESKITKTSGH